MKRQLWIKICSGFCYTFAITAGALFCPVTGFSIPVQTGTLLLLCAALALLFPIFCAFRRGWIGDLIVFLALAAAVWFYWDEFLRAFYLAAGQFVQAFSDAFKLNQVLVIPDGLTPARNADWVLMPFAALIAFFSAYGLEVRRSPAICAAAGIPPLAASLIILETVPAAWAALLLIGALALLLLTQSIRNADEIAAASLSARLVLPLAALIGLLVLISPPSGYERSAWSDQLQSTVSTAAEKLSFLRKNEQTGQMEFVTPFAPSTLGSRVWDSSVEQVNLSRVGPQSKTGRHVMSVLAPVSGDYHLRADALSIYENNSWKALPEAQYADTGSSENALVFPSGAGLSFQIQTDMKSSIFYLPYKPSALPDGGTVYYDAYIRNSKQLTQYSVQYTTDYLWMQTATSDYRNFVNAQYTQLPDSLREGFDAIAAVQQLPKYPESQAQTCAQAVSEMVRAGKTYSLDTPRAPSGEDFTLWFLTQSDTGYCVHFATAAALLLRYCGVPARFVTGYYVSAVQNEWTDVTEDSAHAWVEYFDGDRWMVLEATPPDFSVSSTEIEETAPTEEVPDAETAPENTPETQPDTPDESSKTDADKTGSENIGSNDTHEENTAAAGKHSGFSKLLGWVLGILGFVGAWFAYRVIRLGGRNAQLTGGSTNRQAVMYYRHLRLLSKLTGAALAPELEELACKAKFSQHRLEADELMPLKRRSEELTQQLMQEHHVWKQFLYRMVYVIY